jgi:phosphatidylserine decarboxylase
MLGYAMLGVLLALTTVVPLAWKWQLGVPRTTVAVATFGAFCAVPVALIADSLNTAPYLASLLVWLCTLAGAVAVLIYRFYRDPHRVSPDDEGAIVSPADGQVLYVRRSLGGRLPVATKLRRDYTIRELTNTPLRSDDAVVVGIAMNFLDVHVNRSPIAGTVTLRKHFAGRFGSLRRPEMAFENERATTVIEAGNVQVAVVQIASRLVRQIVSFVEEGQRVSVGQRIGAIRFGSQVDVILPLQGLLVVVQPGQHLVAGESVLAVHEPE